MSSEPKGRVLLGVWDWERPAWIGSFYPGDMPSDWHLTFYNTQYGCVWLPQGRWSAIDADQARQWRDDTHDEFRLILEQPPILDDRAKTVLAVLGDRVAKCCRPDDTELVWFEAGADLKALAAEIREKVRHSNVYLLSRDGHLATLEQVETLLGLLGLLGSPGPQVQ